MNMYKCIGVLLSAALLTTPAAASIVTVDGNLDDWGVTIADNNNSQYNFSIGPNLLASFVEDSDDLAGPNGEVGPDQGGQNYDAEMLAVAYDQGSLFIAIASGQRPDNGFAKFGPGDLRIITDTGVIGMEMGGGIGGEDGGVLLTGDAGSTYELDGNGNTTDILPTDAALTVGSLWRNNDWVMDPIDPSQPTQMTITGDSILVGNADYVYTRDTVTEQHSMIEISIELALLEGALIEGIEWRPACGNDELIVDLNFVPEPATLALIALGGLAMVRRSTRS